MNKRSGSTLVSVICAFFVLCVCSCIVAASFGTLLDIRSRTERFMNAFEECETAYYSGTDTEAVFSESRENITVYDKDGSAVFSFDAVIRKAECSDIMIYGFSADE